MSKPTVLWGLSKEVRRGIIIIRDEQTYSFCEVYPKKLEDVSAGVDNRRRFYKREGIIVHSCLLD